MVQPVWRTVWRFPKKTKMQLPYDPTIPHLGLYLEKVMVQKDTGTAVFIEALSTIAGTWKQPKCPSAEDA